MKASSGAGANDRRSHGDAKMGFARARARLEGRQLPPSRGLWRLSRRQLPASRRLRRLPQRRSDQRRHDPQPGPRYFRYARDLEFTDHDLTCRNFCKMAPPVCLVRQPVSDHVVTGLRVEATNFRTTLLSSGITSSSNHGFFCVQIALRQLGCGNGKNWGPCCENALTVSVMEDFTPAPK